MVRSDGSWLHIEDHATKILQMDKIKGKKKQEWQMALDNWKNGVVLAVMSNYQLIFEPIEFGVYISTSQKFWCLRKEEEHSQHSLPLSPEHPSATPGWVPGESLLS